LSEFFNCIGTGAPGTKTVFDTIVVELGGNLATAGGAPLFNSAPLQ